MISRHVLTIPATGRKVHYRRCGSGPVLLMVHQSPRSSREYIALMKRWGAHFTCIAPDTPGFGQSDALAAGPSGVLPDITDFGAALGEFVDALGSGPCLAYGFHSGGVILMRAFCERPDLFRALAIGGYAVWTADEIAHFGERYLPPFEPQPYGEHLTWLWRRVLEQSWFFPWFDLSEEARLSIAHADLARVSDTVMDLLDAGDAYRAGYGAVLRAPRDLPDADAEMPPVLITAFDGDPLQPHIDRLSELPRGWMAHRVASAQDHEDESLAFLREHCDGEAAPGLAEDATEGWLAVDGALIHWRGGNNEARRLILHPPASEIGHPLPDGVAIDVPGHGLSDDAPDMRGVIEAAARALGCEDIDWPAAPDGDPHYLYPDTAPDRFGAYLHRAWAASREEAMFRPWYAASAEAAIPLDHAALEPAAIARRARARLRAGDSARHYHHLLKDMEGNPS